MNLREFILDLDLKDKWGVRRDCPACNGKNTLNINNVDGNILYNCYHLGCTVRGSIHQGLSAEEIHNRLHRPTLRKPDPETWTVPIYIKLNLSEAPSELITPFINKWNLQDTELWYDIKDKRAVFPIRRSGAVIGATGRALDGAIPKWYHYGITHFYTACQGEPNGVVVIVEDVISAITISSMCQNVTGMALLGTSLTHYHLEYIQDFTKIVVALDPDATKKNLQYKREIVAWTGIDTIALRLQKDPKENNLEDIHNLRGAVT